MDQSIVLLEKLIEVVKYNSESKCKTKNKKRKKTIKGMKKVFIFLIIK